MSKNQESVEQYEAYFFLLALPLLGFLIYYGASQL